MKKLLPHLIGISVFFLVGIVSGIAYVYIVGKVLDRGGDGFGVSAAIVTFPILAIILGALWSIILLIHEKAKGPMGAGRVILFSAILGLIASMVIAGPRGFTMHGGSVLFNWFLIDLVIGGALIQYLIFGRRSRQQPPAD